MTTDKQPVTDNVTNPPGQDVKPTETVEELRAKVAEAEKKYADLQRTVSKKDKQLKEREAQQWAAVQAIAKTNRGAEIGMQLIDFLQRNPMLDENAKAELQRLRANQQAAGNHETAMLNTGQAISKLLADNDLDVSAFQEDERFAAARVMFESGRFVDAEAEVRRRLSPTLDIDQIVEAKVAAKLQERLKELDKTPSGAAPRIDEDDADAIYDEMMKPENRWDDKKYKALRAKFVKAMENKRG